MIPTIPQLDRTRGEQAITNQEPGWERLFACWDNAHSDGSPHFHLAEEPDENPQARSFAAMSPIATRGNKNTPWCAYSATTLLKSKYAPEYIPLSNYCYKGHEFTPENTSYTVSKGKTYRRCKKCHAGAMQAQRERRRLLRQTEGGWF